MTVYYPLDIRTLDEELESGFYAYADDRGVEFIQKLGRQSEEFAVTIATEIPHNIIFQVVPEWNGPVCIMCDGSGEDRAYREVDDGKTFKQLVRDVLTGLPCRACNGHGRQPS